MIYEIVLPGANAFACFLSLLFMVRAKHVLGYMPIDWWIAVPSLIWIGVVYLIYLITGMSLVLLSMLLRGALTALLVTPGVAAYIRMGEFRKWKQ